MIGLNELDEPTGVYTIAGMRGYGKTYAAARIIEGEVAAGNRVLILDIVGALTNYLSYTSVELNAVYGKKTIEKVMDKLGKEPIIFNMSFLHREEIVAQTDIILSLIMADRNKKYVVVIDEVGEVIPQRHEVYSQETERLVRIGRNLGLGKVYLTTQRLQQTDKTAIAQSSYYLVFRMSHNLDIEAMQKILGWNTEEMRKLKGILGSLQLGEFILTDGIDIKGIYKYNNARKTIAHIRPLTKQQKLEAQRPEGPEAQRPRGPKAKPIKKSKLAGKWNEIKEMRDKGATMQNIADKYGVSAVSIYKVLKKMKGAKNGKNN